MSTPHLETIAKRHARIDRLIAEEASKAGSDDLRISKMKRERLSLKDQMTALMN